MPDPAPPTRDLPRRLHTSVEANELPTGSVIVMHHRDHEPVPRPGLTWFRIDRGWINSYGSEVPAHPDWPHIGVLGGPSAVTVTHVGVPNER